MRAAILEGLTEGKTFKDAANDVGVPYGTLRQWRQDDPDFNMKCEQAYDEGTDVLEREAQRRAVDGMEETTIRTYTKDGAEIEEKTVAHRYSDTLMNIMLQGRRPHKYRQKQAVEVTGPDGGPVQAKLEIEFVGAPPAAEKKP